MKMKKMKAAVVTALGGALLLAVSVGATGVSGYETYKSAVKQTMNTKNVTIEAQFSLKDNGKIVTSGTSVQKMDKENSYTLTNVTMNGAEQVLETSRVNGTSILRNGDNYSSKTSESFHGNFSTSSSTAKLAELITDTLIGDTKTQFVTSGDTISIQLKGNQIPELAKLGLTAAFENGGHHGFHSKKDSANGTFSFMPKLVSDIEVKSIGMTAKVSENLLTANSFDLSVTGKDASGASHTFEVNLNAEIIDINATAVKAIDVTGKNVTVK